jgi:hypothetical protein
MTFDFAQLIAHAARTRRLAAGSIVGSGTISNRENGGPGRPVAEGGLGYACIAEQRSVETIEHGNPRRRSCISAIGCASKCWTRPAPASSVPSTSRWCAPSCAGPDADAALHLFP